MKAMERRKKTAATKLAKVLRRGKYKLLFLQWLM